jgi:hypothetical protein
VFTVYACVTNCFKLVDQLPEAVFRWIGITIQHQRIVDGGSVLQSAAGPITAIATQQGIGALQTAGGQVGDGVAKAVGGAAGGGKTSVTGGPGKTDDIK